MTGDPRAEQETLSKFSIVPLRIFYAKKAIIPDAIVMEVGQKTVVEEVKFMAAVVLVGDFLVNAVSKSSGFSRRIRSIASPFRRVPYRYASLHDRLNMLSRPHLPRLVEMRRDFLFRDQYGEMQHDKWALELGQFINETVLPYLGPHKAFAQRRLLYVAGCLDDMVAAAEKVG
jgi:hypothetical protein